MTLCASLAATMHQHDHSSYWMQYSPQTHDSPSELQQKRQSLLLLRKAITAYINRGQRNDDTTRPAVHQQGLGSQGNPAAPRFTSTVQLHQVPAAPQLLTVQEDFAQAAHRIQQAKTQVQPSLQQLPSPQHAAQQQQQTRQQPQPQQSSHPRDLLSRLLGPVHLPVSATVEGAAALGSTVQEGIEQHQQQLQERPEHKQGINHRDLLSRLVGPAEPDAASAARAAVNSIVQEPAGLAAQGLAEQQQQQQQQQVQEPPQLQQGTNHRDFLSRLFGPADTRTGNKTADILAQQDRLEQQQQDQQQLWQSRKKQKTVGQQQHMQQPLQQIQLPQSLQQQWRPKQQGGRRRMLPQQQSKLAPQPQQQQGQREQQLEQPSKQQIQQQQQRYDLWEQMGHPITHDAQSQAAIPGAPRVAAAAAAAADTGAAITAGAHQLKPLLSPRTATHVPQSSRKAWQGNCAVAEQQQWHQGQHSLLQQLELCRDHHHHHQQQQLPQHNVLGALELQQPPEQRMQASDKQPGLSQEQQQQHEAPQVAAAGADSTPTPCQVVPGTPLDGTLAPASGAAAAAGSSSAAAGDGSGPCLVFGSFVAESPAAAAAAALPPQAAKAVAARQAATVSHNPIAAPAVATAAAAKGDVAFVAESPAPGDVGMAHGHTAAAAAVPLVAFVAESPALAPPPTATAEAGDCVVQRLFTEEDRPSLLQQHQQQQQMQQQQVQVQQQEERREQATTAAAAGRGDQLVRLSTAADDGLLPAQEVQQQLQQQVHAQVAGAHAATPIRAAAAAAGGPEQHGAVVSSSNSSSSIDLSMQQPLVSIDVGLPVINVVTCQQQCLVIMQQQQQTSTGSSRFELLLLQVHRQQRHHAVSITMGGLAALSIPGHAGAAAAAATSSLLANCVKLLPVCTSPGHSSSRTGGVRLAQHLPAAVIAAVDSIEISSAVVGDSTAAAAAASSASPLVAAAGVTPTGAPAQHHTDHKTPNSSSVSTGKRSLSRSLTRSSSDRKPLLGRIAAANSAAAAAGIEPQQQHGVNIYRMTQDTEQLSSADPHHRQQQQQEKVELIQRLHTAAAVTCLAVCEQQRLLAAAGASGYACVWTLLPHRQQQQLDAVVDLDSAVVLPAAAYRGISFPDVSDLCFIVQPASSSSDGGGGNGATSSSSRGLRVLLVGSCSQGSVAVWDVQQQQQIVSVHSPDINIHGLLPLQGPTVSSSSSGSSEMLGPAKQQQGDLYQQQQQQPEHETLLLLALVAAKGSSSSCLTAAAVAPERRLRTPPPLLLPQQQQVLELRPILLQQPGLLTAGTSVLRHTLTSDHQTHATLVQSAAILGRVATAATHDSDSNALVTVWDIVTGRVLMTAGKTTTAAPAKSLTIEDSLTVGLLLGGDQQQQQEQQDDHCAGTAVTHGCCVPVVAVIGSSSGVLTLALL